ncbi:hypothetical protein [Microcoleus vaginatus]|uniref:hypothetical protein n=1 Tax=Microcoleus vaginatus TaxID=119532 RepID=UPI0002F32A73
MLVFGFFGFAGFQHIAEGRRKKEEGRGKREGRRKEEGRRKKEKGVSSLREKEEAIDPLCLCN